MKTKKKREREREVGSSERHYGWGGGEQNLSSVLKVPRHCPFVLLVNVTMKNAVFWDIKPISYRTGDTLRLQNRGHPVNAM
jgi:hypothetical protein